MSKEMRGFEDLECYQLAMLVFREAYKIASQLPTEEKFNLADQLRRAGTSSILNIAEGYGRFHYLDSLRFFYIARGSIMETLSAFIACHELKYIDNKVEQQRELCHSALRSLNGYIRYIRTQQQGKAEYGEHAAVKEDMPSYDTDQFSNPQSTSL